MGRTDGCTAASLNDPTLVAGSICTAAAICRNSLLALNEIIKAERIANIRNFARHDCRRSPAASAIQRRWESYGGGGGRGDAVFSEIISVFINSPTIPARFRDIRARLAAGRWGGCHGAARSIGLGNELSSL